VAHTLVIAHRGASRAAPENTLPAIAKAVEAGADIIALDVQGTRDHVPLLFADTRLDRTTNRTGRLAELTAREAQELDAGSWLGAEHAGTRIPTLSEALAAVGAQTRVMLVLPELRSAAALAENIRAALAGRPRPADDVLLFPDSDSLKKFHEAAPAFGCALALGEKIEGWVHVEKAVKLGLKIIRPYRSQAKAALVRQAHERGLLVFAHFADEEEDMRELLKVRVDGIVTSQLERLKRLGEE
jgi:glycerophosphoryl diester phosphodiesterase